ncbi:MAG: hypothetical protein B0W54_02525 [Cellvibrio sp. 79]|nr:MAG: hypothetical protein B0W54_02525 [Cellvibrio sp. 79]
MISLQRIFAATILLTSSLCATYTQAHWQFTYTSDELPLVAGYLGGEPSDLVGTREPPFPFFSVTFTSNDSLASTGTTTLQLHNPSTTANWPDYTMAEYFAPQTPSFITLNSDGTILDWEFSLEYFYRGTGPDVPPGEIRASVQSYLGGDDRFEYKTDIYTQRPFNTWQYVNTVETHYAGASDWNNWVIEKIDVPEPHPLMLIVVGLGMLMINRVRVNRLEK